MVVEGLVCAIASTYNFPLTGCLISGVGAFGILIFQDDSVFFFFFTISHALKLPYQISTFIGALKIHVLRGHQFLPVKFSGPKN